MLSKLLQPEVLVFIIPIVAIVGGLIIKAIKLNYAHEERIAKINAGIDPDTEYDDVDELELDQNYQKKKVRKKA